MLCCVTHAACVSHAVLYVVLCCAVCRMLWLLRYAALRCIALCCLCFAHPSKSSGSSQPPSLKILYTGRLRGGKHTEWPHAAG